MIPWLVLLQATLTIATAGPPTSPEYLPLWVAQGEGYFAGENLSVSLETTRAEVPAAEALARGRADLAATSFEAALLMGSIAGAPPKVVFGLAETPAVALLVSRARAVSIRALGDLVGETVGVPAPGTPAEFMLVSLLTNAGIRVSQLKIKSYGERGLVKALESGEVAAAMLGDPYATRLVEEGRAAVLADLRKRDGRERWVGKPQVFSALFARADAQVGPAVLEPLSRALLRALERIRTAAPEELRTRLPAAVVGFPEDFSARLLGGRQIFIPDGWVTPEMLRASIAAMRARGPIPTKVDVPRNLDQLLLTDSLKQVLEKTRR
jgi:ABC-type nitrate/sulfonate/bicarbonate transport system substrate-binding protein